MSAPLWWLADMFSPPPSHTHTHNQMLAADSHSVSRPLPRGAVVLVMGATAGSRVTVGIPSRQATCPDSKEEAGVHAFLKVCAPRYVVGLICHLLCASSHRSITACRLRAHVYDKPLSRSLVLPFWSEQVICEGRMKDHIVAVMCGRRAQGCTFSHAVAPSIPHLIKRMNQVRLDPAGGNRKVSSGVYRQIVPWTLSSLFPAEESGEMVFMTENDCFCLAVSGLGALQAD